jgi:two-component system sensor kinase FixL
VSRPTESIAEPVGLDAVLTTAELARRPARPPDHAAEAKALAALARTLAESPRSILQTLADLALELCRADSTGVSILESGGTTSVCRWPAIAGQFAANLMNGTMPRDASPCGTVLDRNSALLFARPERHFAYPVIVDPPIVEALLVPFHHGGKPVGTVWAVAHTEGRKFDAEDVRLLTSLSGFAAAAYQLTAALDAAEAGKAELERRVAERTRELSAADAALRREVAERERAEAVRSHLAAIVESSSDAIVSKTLTGAVVSWNAGAERIYGYSAAEAVGRPITFIVPPDRSDELEVILDRVRRGERVDPFETVRVRKDGRRIDVSLTLSPIRDAAGRVIGSSAIARDVTEQKRAAEELRSMTQQLWQAAKLASVGELAASVAHELNNPLATVSLRVESALAITPADDPRRAALEVIAQETERMGELVANVLQFSRRGTGQVSAVDVRPELTKAVDLIHHHLRKRSVAVVREFAADTPVVRADPQKLRQVFLNLLTNAGDAMPGGGTLTLRTAATALPGGRPAVLMEFADTGTGIPAEHLGAIMEPFFTTKEEGKGTGLGLAICRRVVEEHHGTIRVTSEVGKGTTVRIVLPVAGSPNRDQSHGPGGAG